MSCNRWADAALCDLPSDSDRQEVMRRGLLSARWPRTTSRLPLHSHEHRSEYSIHLPIHQELGEGAALCG